MATQKATSMSAFQTRARHGTPGRKGKSDNQYFEIGKLGRKTGITLEDTGVRDDHGLEPVSGIFSSPTSPQWQRQTGGDDSTDMVGLESSAPEVNTTLNLRNKTPRLPPARSSPFKSTQISGSPRRHSSIRPQSRNESSPLQSRTQPPPSSKLNYTTFNEVRQSIEAQSPFKPRRVLRRSVPARIDEGSSQVETNPPDPLEKEYESRYRRQIAEQLDSESGEQEHDGTREGVQQLEEARDDSVEGAPLDMSDAGDFGDFAQNEGLQDSTGEEIDGAIGMAGSLLHTSSPSTARQRRKSELRQFGEQVDSGIGQYSPPVAQMQTPPSRKRNRHSLRTSEHIHADDETPFGSAHDPEPASGSRRRQSRISKSQHGDSVADVEADDEIDANIRIDPALLAHGDSYDVPEHSALFIQEEEPAREASVVQESLKRATKAPVTKARRKRPSPAPRRSPSSASSSDRTHVPVRRGGSVSNVHLRASTPFEDARQRTSRSGRPIMKPLNYWAGETVIWKHGEVDGVIRADSVEPEKKKIKRRKPPKTTTKAKRTNLDAIDEEARDTVPSDWEEDIGVLAGTVAQWDPEIGFGDRQNMIMEDLAFAASSIIHREVEDSTFTYAKIQTLPFFGSGIVELPPAGWKRAKNSRKMQMNFFVHKGKISVDIAPPVLNKEAGDAQPESLGKSFTLTEGGAFIVPRGNNYAIQNASSTQSASVFFSQGCEVLALQ